MKQFYLLLSVLMLSTGLAAQTFVDADATGANDGTSWADAYTSLDDALANATDGDEIWIADGTYIPSGDRFMVMNGGVSLIGGFNGTETSADDADPEANPTFLSGDVNGDDDFTDLNLNRLDNKRIMFVDSMITDAVSITGLVFTGGQTAFDVDGTAALEDISGASLQAFAPVIIDDCDFVNSNSDLGNVIILTPNSSGSMVSNSVFTNNIGLTRAGGLYGNTTADLTVTGCEFSFNSGARGAAYMVLVPGLTIEDCLFEFNACADRGAGLGIVQCDGVVITGTDFENNIGTDAAVRGGAVYIFDDATLDPDASRVIFDDCTFTANASQGLLGGAVYQLNADATYSNCEFADNAGGVFGGGVFVFAADLEERQTNFDNCLFEGNQGGAGLGSALSAIGTNELNVTNSDFVSNGADDVACRGAIGLFGSFDTLAIRSQLNIDSVNFVTNSSSDIGSAIYNQSPTGVSEMLVTNTTFAGNQAAGAPGGAIYMFSSVEATFDNITASFNQGSDGGFMLTRGEAPDLGAGTRDVVVTVQNSTLVGNISASQGGAIDAATGGDLDIINSEFYDNLAQAGSGGAIIGNGDTVGQVINIMHSTFVGNIASGDPGVVVGDDVAAFTSGAVPASQVTMVNIENNAFASTTGFGNVAVEPDADGGTPVITTTGGNLFAQEPFDFDLADTDIFVEDLDPTELFVNYDVGSDDIDLTPNMDFDGGNPLINNAVPSDIETDRDGDPRLMPNDIGAQEKQVNVVDIIVNSEVHTTLEDLVITAGLVETLSGEGPFTVFAPTDDAFGLLTADELASATDQLENTLLTHVAAGQVFSGDLSDGQVIPSLFAGADLNITIDGNGVQVSTPGSELATVIVADLEATNGVVHVIDRVLLSILVDVRNIDEAGLDVQFFPNPVQDYMSVNVQDVTAEQIEVSVLNLNGQRVNNWVMGNGSNVIDFTRLPAGTYTLEVNIDGQLYSKKVVKQ